MSSRSKKKRGRPRKVSKLPAEEKLRLLTESASLSDEEGSGESAISFALAQKVSEGFSLQG